MSLTKVSYAMIQGEASNVLDFGADATGSVDSSSAFTQAFANSNIVYVPQGSYKLTSTVTIPAYGLIYGAGFANTTITASDVAFVTQIWSQLRQMKIVGSVGHTKNLIEVGSTLLDSGRAIISDVWVQGAGIDGIQLIHGNLGVLENITSINNTTNGIRFLSGNGDLNGWTTQGYIDVRGNGNDGFNVESGASLGDALCSKANFFNNILAQENTRYGVYIGTRSNIVSAYGELNGTADVQLGTYARGNDVTTVEGHVVDSSGNPSFNLVSNYNGVAGYQRLFQNQTLFSGKTGCGLSIYNDDLTAGALTFSKTAARTFAITGEQSSGTFTLAIKNAAAPSAYITTTFGGIAQPDTDNVFNLGTASYRWATVYAGTGAINTSDGNEKTDIRPLDYKEKAVALAIKARIKAFKFKDAVATKGKDARIHFGVIAQDVKEAFEAEGLDATKYGVFCSDILEDGTERLGVRYDELLAFIVAVS